MYGNQFGEVIYGADAFARGYASVVPASAVLSDDIGTSWQVVILTPGPIIYGDLGGSF